MSKDAPNSGFLSKIVKFVRHPATSWADLDQAGEGRDVGQSQQALKEMIERKRRNDFVRKREFDMLRKLRTQVPAVSGSYGGRPSFFQSSYSSKPDDRAGTLKKIDEIEAQISMQWWKTKQGEGYTRNPPASPPDAGDSMRAYRTTVPEDNAATVPYAEPVPKRGHNTAQTLSGQPPDSAGLDIPFTPTARAAAGISSRGRPHQARRNGERVYLFGVQVLRAGCARAGTGPRN